MKAILRRAFLLAALLGALLGTTRAFAEEVITSFDSNVEVAKDGELTVTETLGVHAEGIEMRHGIYRDFPLLFRDAGGVVREVTFSVLGVTRDGVPEPYHTDHQHNYIRIYAGDKDVFIQPGSHVYTFRYRTARQVRWFGGKPELNWNVTGNFWRFPIYKATYSLHLVDNAPVVRWTAFTGRLGARGTDWRGGIAGDGTLEVGSTRTLRPGEGLTVVAELPGSAVNPPSQSDLFWYQLFDNRQWLIGGIGFLAVLIFYFVAWEAVGRDPKGGTIIPLFHPPQGISPPLANYIREWGFTREKWRAFTAGALSLAVRGLVRFDQSGDALKLTRTGKQPEGGYQALPAGERAIFSWVNVGGTAVIDKAHGEQVFKVGEEFTKSIEAENRNRFFRRNLGYVAAGAAMTVAVIIGVIKFGGLADSDVGLIIGCGFAGFAIGLFVVPFITALLGDGAKFPVIFRGIMALMMFVIFFSVGASFLRTFLANGVAEAMPQLWGFLSAYPFPLVLITAFTTLNGFFLYLMRAPTALGRPIMDQLAGFRLYMETAESDRLNMQAPELTAARFEELLPYAVALDVEKPWAHAFEQALRRAHPNDPDAARHYQPGWGSGGGWSSGNFSGAVASSVGAMTSALASAVPASSGSSGFGGGGGGSGGGGGGGGGGGW